MEIFDHHYCRSFDGIGAAGSLVTLTVVAITTLVCTGMMGFL